MHGLILLLNTLNVGEGISQNLRFLQRSRTNASSLLVNTSRRDRFLQRKELSIHICAVPLLDNVVGRAFGGIPHLWVRAGSGVIGVLRQAACFAGGYGFLARSDVFFSFNFGT